MNTSCKLQWTDKLKCTLTAQQLRWSMTHWPTGKEMPDLAFRGVFFQTFHCSVTAEQWNTIHNIWIYICLISCPCWCLWHDYLWIRITLPLGAVFCWTICPWQTCRYAVIFLNRVNGSHSLPFCFISVFFPILCCLNDMCHLPLALWICVCCVSCVRSYITVCIV